MWPKVTEWVTIYRVSKKNVGRVRVGLGPKVTVTPFTVPPYPGYFDKN